MISLGDQVPDKWAWRCNFTISKTVLSPPPHEAPLGLEESSPYLQFFGKVTPQEAFSEPHGRSVVDLKCHDFHCTTKWSGFTWTHTHSLSDSFPTWIVTEYRSDRVPCAIQEVPVGWSFHIPLCAYTNPQCFWAPSLGPRWKASWLEWLLSPSVRVFPLHPNLIKLPWSCSLPGSLLWATRMGREVWDGAFRYSLRLRRALKDLLIEAVHIVVLFFSCPSPGSHIMIRGHGQCPELWTLGAHTEGGEGPADPVLCSFCNLV